MNLNIQYQMSNPFGKLRISSSLRLRAEGLSQSKDIKHQIYSSSKVEKFCPELVEGFSTCLAARRARSNNKLFGYLLFVVFVIFVVFPGKALGQQLSLGVYPPVTKVDALPPVSLHIPLRVQNTGDDAIDVGISLKPFKSSSTEDGSITYLKDTSAFPSGNILLLKKITVSDDDKTVNTVSLLPKEEREVSVDIPIGKNEIPGDYYFSVVFTSRLSSPTSAEDNSQASTAQAGVASHIILSVGPKGSSTGKITEFSTPFFQTEGPVPFTLRLTNTSKNAIAPSGNILITNMFGQTIGKVDLLPVDVLSNTTRIIPDRAQINKEGVVNEDLYNKFLSTGPKAIWPEKFLLGFYSAHVTLKLSDDGPILRSSTSFLALPVQFLVGLLLGLVLVFTIVKRVKEKLKHVPNK